MSVSLHIKTLKKSARQNIPGHPKHVHWKKSICSHLPITNIHEYPLPPPPHPIQGWGSKHFEHWINIWLHRAIYITGKWTTTLKICLVHAYHVGMNIDDSLYMLHVHLCTCMCPKAVTSQAYMLLLICRFFCLDLIDSL